MLHRPRAEPIAGGCINRAYRLNSGAQQLFVKVNRAERLAMFAAEAAGLTALQQSGAVRVPTPIYHGSVGAYALLVLEYLPLQGGGCAAALGRAVAALHTTHGERFGWSQHNYIGETLQQNSPQHEWCHFWQQQRLAPQLAQIAQQHESARALISDGEALLAELPALFADHRPAPSLLHGDLWSGNVGCSGGTPVIFDPAVYYGDHEADIAMSELFGGFSPAFYHAYREALPLAAGYPLRRTLYNLYHILNHFLIFGGGYGREALSMIAQLRAELRG